METLYILLRTDMASMTAGRCAAMASHATSVFEQDAAKTTDNLEEYINAWKRQTKQNFGTVIVLNGRTWNDIVAAVGDVRTNVEDDENQIMTGTFYDPEYMLQDGNIVHVVPDVNIGAYVFIGNRNFAQFREVMGKHNFELL